MTRRLDLPVSDTTASVVIAAGLGAVLAITFTMAWVNDSRAPASAPAVTDPYESCLLAANEPGPSGFATEVCEPLSPFYKPTSTVYVGPLSWTNDDGSEVHLPPLAVQVADSCPEADDGVQRCVEALIRERQERAR